MSAAPLLLLASTSPRRSALLSAAGLAFECCEPGPEYHDGGHEHATESGAPRQLAIERARRKATGAVVVRPDLPILAVDTVVDLDGEEVSKAADRAAAERLLRQLAGRRHRVHTAHCLWSPALLQIEELCATAVVACRAPSEAELQRYLDSEQWRGKAGAYGIQDPAQDLFELVEGALDTVIGLHVPHVRTLLQRCGIEA